jgi:hypothetical protein
MHDHLENLPAADSTREADARELFPYKELSPEEYAAREGHRWLCFSFGEYRYSDPDLNDWIHTLDDILFTPGALDRVREQLLTADERDQIRKESEEGM